MPEADNDEMVIRPAEPADAMAVARVHVCSWQAAYRGLLPREYLDTLRPEDRASRYDFATTDPATPYTLVAQADGEIVGFATTCAGGELCALYVAPQFWGKGFGAALISAARARLLELGFKTAHLWLLEGNQRAAHFYQRDGWKPDGQTRTDTVWGITVNEVRYERSKLTP
jgi:GNAT superfamily N-acetyltransferase